MKMLHDDAYMFSSGVGVQFNIYIIFDLWRKEDIHKLSFKEAKRKKKLLLSLSRSYLNLNLPPSQFHTVSGVLRGQQSTVTVLC